MLPAYYTLNDEEKDYICSQNEDNGMHSCFDLPPTRGHDALICNATANMALGNGSCVNWNYYYTECKSQGENPFQGTISFDNIGLAWVAIFVVSTICVLYSLKLSLQQRRRYSQRHIVLARQRCIGHFRPAAKYYFKR